MFSFLVLLLAYYVGAGWTTRPPKLHAEEELYVHPEQDDFHLICEGEGIVTWRWNTSLPKDEAVIETKKQNSSQYPFTSTLTVYNPLSNYTGLYHCQYNQSATNLEANTDSVSSTTHVFIYAAPTVEMKGVPYYVKAPRSLSVYRVPPLTVTCQAEGLPVPSIMWHFQTCKTTSTCSPFENITAVKESLTYPDPGNLVVSTATIKVRRNGFLRCLANNSLGTDNSTVPVVLIDHRCSDRLCVLRGDGMTHVELTASAVLDAVINDYFGLRCLASKFYYQNATLETPPGYEGEVKEWDDEYIWSKTTTVWGVKNWGDGNFSCEAVRYDNTTEMKEVTVNVIEYCDGHCFYHSDVKTYTELTASAVLDVVINDFFALRCLVRKLHYREALLETPPGYEGEVEGSDTLFHVWKRTIVRGVREWVTGNFSCQAVRHNNTTEMKEVTVNVIEEEPVSFLKDSNMRNTTITAKETSTFLINCTVSGWPRATIKWLKDGKPLSLNGTFFDNTTTLLPDDMQRVELKYVIKLKHEGVYTCTAENRLDSVTGTLNLTVAERDSTTTAGHSTTKLVIGSTVPSVICVTVVTFLVRYIKKQQVLLHSARERANKYQKGNVAMLSPKHPAGEQAALLPYDKKWEVSRDKITLGSYLGSGAFGQVVKAKLRGPEGSNAATVAVKMCKSDAESCHVRALSLELKIMIHLGKHLNIVNVMGANTKYTTTKTELWIVEEYCRLGDLGRFMHIHRDKFIDQINRKTRRIDINKGGCLLSGPDDEEVDSAGTPMIHEMGNVPGVSAPFTTSDLVCWAWQVAHGMDFLGSRKVLHGDLAARNLLLADDNVVKISDFGLSRKLYNRGNYQKKETDVLPMKWMSVEAIRDSVFSVQSDVWAFGVTLWEMFTLGSTPYPCIHGKEELLRQLESGYRMPCPKYADRDIYTLMMGCWKANPRDRPSFKQAIEKLGAMMRPRIKEELLSMNRQYVRENEQNITPQTDYLSRVLAPNFENISSMEQAESSHSTSQVHIESPEVVSYANTRTPPPPTVPATTTSFPSTSTSPGTESQAPHAPTAASSTLAPQASSSVHLPT